MSEQKPEAVDPRVAAAFAHNAQIGGSRMISYGGLDVMVPVRDVREAINALKAGDRIRIMNSVLAALRRTFPKVKRGTASQKAAMNCAQDIAIWFANEIIEGRATLEIS